ncbi:WecB/TagA/CpsF family glycosyltransferase [uncultured Pontibacter sp.]|uniref:WecB/TagA/CpsF family glycosyltransferase n=1 Tax=uncultured Pontibacter sp. TaxID=453356 RepID=UPI00261407BD|nr:WecB/TagA/CpsF family glycosyltransferase [uncultured Pontibacter sp.]
MQLAIKMNRPVNFLNLRFKGLVKEEILKESSYLKHVITVNADFIVEAQRNSKFRYLINNNYSTFDGQVPLTLARKKNPDIYIEKISGSDFIYDICLRAQQSNKRVFLLGGSISSNAKSVEKLKHLYNIQIEGFSPPYSQYPFPESLNNIILEKIKDFKPHYLLVGFGMIKQEYWIEEHKHFLEENNVKLAIGVGGTFSFVSENVKRAPKLVQDIGLEWMFRILQEPRRLFKRYLISNTSFIWYYLKSLSQ